MDALKEDQPAIIDKKEEEEENEEVAVMTARTSLASDIVSTAPGSPVAKRSPMLPQSSSPNVDQLQKTIGELEEQDESDKDWHLVQEEHDQDTSGEGEGEGGSQGPIDAPQEESVTIPRFEDLKSSESGNQLDDFGFFHNSSSPTTAADTSLTLTDDDIQKHRQRESQWVDILQQWPSSPQEQSDRYKELNFDKLKELCRKGIPVSVRGRVWSRLVNVDKYRQEGLYEQLVKTTEPPLDIMDVIERDINRCYPDHFFFRDKSALGQRHLFDLLKAYARYNPAVGYCQGMGRLVGLMLMQMPVEECFWLLVATLEGPLKDYFTPSLDRFRIHVMVFEKLLADQMPRLYKHLIKNDVSPLIYVTNWFLTVYTMVLPWETVLRVWDMFYCEGVKVMFRTALAIMKRCERALLKQCPSSTELMQFITRVPREYLQEAELLREMSRISLGRKQVQELERKATDLWTKADPTDRANLSLVKQRK